MLVYDTHTHTQDVDELLFCTGYTYRFPFLEGGNNTLGAGPAAPVVSVRDNTVYPLYRHMLPPAAPSIAFIGLPAKVIPFPQFEVQSRYVSQVWAGNVTLPAAAAMLREIEEEVEHKRRAGVPRKYFHVQGGAMFAYNDALSAESGGPMTPPWRVMMHNACSRNKRTHPEEYRDMPLPSVADYQHSLLENA